MLDLILEYDHICIPRTQMTLVLLEKGLLLEGSTPKIEDKQVPGRCNNLSSCSSCFFSCDNMRFLDVPLLGYFLLQAECWYFHKSYLKFLLGKYSRSKPRKDGKVLGV